MKHRPFVLALAFALVVPSGAVLFSPRSARASVAVAASLDDLAAESTYVVVATAGQSYCVWEDLPSGRRIVTYTKLSVERAIAGAPEKELWVRTLGGHVDHIGQAVEGEARFADGSRSLLFLLHAPDATVVSERAQGQFPIVAGAAGAPDRLAPSPDAGALVPRNGAAPLPRSAREQLAGTTVDDAAIAIADATRRLHGAK